MALKMALKAQVLLLTKRKEDRDRYLNLLRKAGMPE